MSEIHISPFDKLKLSREEEDDAVDFSGIIRGVPAGAASCLQER
jgi:hypothetical protein